MNDSDPHPARGAVAAGFAIIYLVWGSTYLAIRVAVGQIPAFLMAGIRFAIAGGVLMVALRLRGSPWPSRREWRQQALAGVLLILAGNGLVCWAEQAIPSGLTTLIVGASPLIVTLMEQFLPGGQRPGLVVWLGIIIGLCGLVLLLGPGAFPAGDRPPWPCVAALIAASICWWAGSIYNQRRGPSRHPLMAAGAQMAIGSVALLLSSLCLGEWRHFHPAAVSARAWGAVAYLIVMGSLVAYTTYLWLLRHSTTARVSTFAYVNPVVAVLLGWAVLDEPIGWRTAAAAAIVIGAVAVITVGKLRPRAPAGTDLRSRA